MSVFFYACSPQLSGLNSKVEIMYLTTKEVKARYRISRGTIYRWMEDDHRPAPMPKPRLRGTAGNNRWLESDLVEWERNCHSAAL